MGVMPCPLIKTLIMHRPIKAMEARLPWKQNGQIKKVWLSLCMQVWMQKIRYHSLNFDKLIDGVRRERKGGGRETETKGQKKTERER